MNTYSEPSYPISKIEYFDEDNLRHLQRSDNYPKNVKAQLSNYSKHRTSGGKLSTTYKLADNCQEYGIGRLYPIDQLSISGMRFDVRNPLAEKYYWDVDMENAHYRIALKYCKDNGLPHEYIKQYVENRNDMLIAVSSSRKKAKTEFLKILYGGDIKTYSSNYDEVEGEINQEGLNLLKSLQSEVFILMEIIWSKNSHLHDIKVGSDKKALSKLADKKARATLMSLIFQTEERKLLMFIDAFMKSKNRNMDVYIHDGGYIRKLEGESCFPEQMLQECSEKMLEILGYDIPLAQKPITYEKLEFVAKNDYYANKKIEIEKTYAQVGGDFIEIVEDDEPRAISYKDMKAQFKMFNYDELNFETNKKTKKYFFDTWTDDINHRFYKRMDFIPIRSECPDDVYNLFTGFQAEKLIGHYEYNREIIQPIINHLDILTENNSGWFLKWLACKIQHPNRKTEILPLLRDVEGFLELCGGTGKTCFIDWFGSEILGEKYYMAIHNNEDLYNSFNGQFEGKLLIHLEEAEGTTHHKNDNILKAKTTGKKQLVNKKQINAYKVNDYADIIASTNNKNPLKVNLSNRRISAFDVNSKYRNDSVYFKTLLDTFRNKQAIYSFYVYLRDEVEVPNKFDVVKTAANADMTLMNTQLHYKWILSLVRDDKLDDMYSNDAYNNYVEYGKLIREDKGTLTLTAFGLLFAKTDLIEKTRDKHGMKYKFNKDGITQKLKELGILEKDFETPNNECLINSDDEEDEKLSDASTTDVYTEVYIDGILQAD
jgi:hypothetical protein